MPLYEYRAHDAAGKERKGLVDASSSASAYQRLKEQGLFPSKLQENSGYGARGIGLCLWLSSDRWYEKGYADGRVFFLVPNEKLENWEDGCETLSLPRAAETFPQGNYTVFVFAENPLPGIAERGRACREGEGE